MRRSLQLKLIRMSLIVHEEDIPFFPIRTLRSKCIYPFRQLLLRDVITSRARAVEVAEVLEHIRTFRHVQIVIVRVVVVPINRDQARVVAVRLVDRGSTGWVYRWRAR